MAREERVFVVKRVISCRHVALSGTRHLWADKPEDLAACANRKDSSVIFTDTMSDGSTKVSKPYNAELQPTVLEIVVKKAREQKINKVVSCNLSWTIAGIDQEIISSIRFKILEGEN